VWRAQRKDNRRRRRWPLWLWLTLTLSLTCGLLVGATYFGWSGWWRASAGGLYVSVFTGAGRSVLLWECDEPIRPLAADAHIDGRDVYYTYSPVVTPDPELVNCVGLMLRTCAEDWPTWRPDMELHKTCGAVSLPLWIPTVLFAALAAWHWRRTRPVPPGHCPRCGYDLTGNVSGRCPECGEAAGVKGM
jgi:hypothetical protein